MSARTTYDLDTVRHLETISTLGRVSTSVVLLVISYSKTGSCVEVLMLIYGGKRSAMLPFVSVGQSTSTVKGMTKGVLVG